MDSPAASGTILAAKGNLKGQNIFIQKDYTDHDQHIICCLDRAPFGKLLHFTQNVHSIFIQNLNLKIASS